MSFSFKKQPGETVRIGTSFTNVLASGDLISSATYVVYSGDTVVTAALTVAGSGKITNETLNAVPSVNDTASVQLISGDSGFLYKLTILATTASGDKYESDVNVYIQNN